MQAGFFSDLHLAAALEEQEGACPVDVDGTTRNVEFPSVGAAVAGAADAEEDGAFFRRVTITVLSRGIQSLI